MILLRHAQSEFNVVFARTRRDPGIEDPVLTEEGRRQAREAATRLAEEIERGRPIRRIVASPYRRALMTAEILAEALPCPIRVEPLVRERYAFTCDVGSPRSALEADWPHLDFGALPERWWPEAEEGESGVLERSRRFRSVMAAEPDWPEVLVVSHWGFIRALTGEAIGNADHRRFDPTGP